MPDPAPVPTGRDSTGSIPPGRNSAPSASKILLPIPPRRLSRRDSRDRLEIESDLVKKMGIKKTEVADSVVDSGSVQRRRS